jgi:hypothetical protein
MYSEIPTSRVPDVYERGAVDVLYSETKIGVDGSTEEMPPNPLPATVTCRPFAVPSVVVVPDPSRVYAGNE